MKRLLFYFAICIFQFAFCNLPVHAQGTRVLGLVDNEYQYGETSGAGWERPQRIIADGDTLTGINARLSKITAPAGFTGTGSSAFVTTQNYDTTGTLGAKVQHITIDGGHTTAAGDGLSSITNGVDLDSLDGTVEFSRIHRFRGTGVTIDRDHSGVGTVGYSDAGQVRFCEIAGCHIGIAAGMPDQRFTGNMVVGNRDYGLHIGFGESTCQSCFNHYYGAQTAAVYTDGNETISVCDEFADAAIGLDVGGNGYNSVFVASTFQNNWDIGARLGGKAILSNGYMGAPQSSTQHTTTKGIHVTSPNVVISNMVIDINWQAQTSGSGFHTNDGGIVVASGMNFGTIRDVRSGCEYRRRVHRPAGVAVLGADRWLDHRRDGRQLQQRQRLRGGLRQQQHQGLHDHDPRRGQLGQHEPH